MARQLSREQGITLRGSADIVAEFFCESPAQRAGGRQGGSQASVWRAGMAAPRQPDGVWGEAAVGSLGRWRGRPGAAEARRRCGPFPERPGRPPAPATEAAGRG